MVMKALITGAGGFTGRHLTQLLKSQKITVIKFAGDLKNQANVRHQLLTVKPNWIFHLASPILRADRLLDKNLAANLEVDLFGTTYLLEAAANLKTKPKILITGTAAQYAPSPQPLTETSPLKPLTSYGLSKLTQELVSRKLAQSYHLPLVFTRTFLLIGPGQKPGFAVNDLCRAVAKGQTQLVLGNPAIRRDFTDVRDACRAYYLLMQTGQVGEVYNVCSGQTVSLTEIVNRLAVLIGSKLTLKTKTVWRQNDPPVVCGDNRKLTHLGWQPQISLDQSLTDTLNYWRIF
jgi:GDP-4-dehydro-6-deoxy-D-mannose reductase